MRGIFFEEEHARAVVERLTREGYAAELTRERLAGEDDDEDHPWAVLSDAPETVLDLLVEQYDGWLDLDKLDRRGGELDRRGGELDRRLELPTQPRRIKRPPTGHQSAH